MAGRNQISDRELISLFRDNSRRQEALRIILDRYKQKLYWHIRRMLVDHDDADDALQNTFIKVWENMETFREDAQLYTWIYRIATNEALMILRKKKPNFSLEDSEGEPIDIPDRDPYIDGEEIQLKLQRAIQELPEKQKLVFNMKYFDEMTYEDMSEVLGTSVGALKASYFHAVKKIEYHLQRSI